MARYHVSKNGEPAVCSARYNCPLGGDGDHIDTTDINEARSFAEAKNAEAAGGFTAQSVKRGRSSLKELYEIEKGFSEDNKLGLSPDEVDNAPNSDDLNKAISRRVEAEKEYREAFDTYLEIRKTAPQDSGSDSDEILDAQARYLDAETKRSNAVTDLTREKNIANGRAPGWSNNLEEGYAEPSRGRYTEEQLWGKHPKTQVGSNTPWGKADFVDSPAHGIVVVQTPSHGGIKLSAKRNKKIPEPLRNASGWYEEDSESQIVGWKYPEAFPQYTEASGGPKQASRTFEKNVRDSYPEEYEEATGKKVSKENSYGRRMQDLQERDRKLREDNPDKFVSGNANSSYSWTPKGYRVNHAKKHSTGETRDFLVKEDGTESLYGKAFIIDESKHIDITDIRESARKEVTYDKHPFRLEPEDPKYGKDLGISTDKLSASAKNRAEKELNTRYRFPTGNGTTEIKTLKEHLENSGVTGKYAHWDGSKIAYTIQYGEKDPYVHHVSRATFDAFGETKDLTGPLSNAQIESEKSKKALERSLKKYQSNSIAPQAQATLSEARRRRMMAEERYNKLAEENRKSWKEASVQRENLEKEAWEKLVKEKNLQL